MGRRVRKTPRYRKSTSRRRTYRGKSSRRRTSRGRTSRRRTSRRRNSRRSLRGGSDVETSTKALYDTTDKIYWSPQGTGRQGGAHPDETRVAGSPSYCLDGEQPKISHCRGCGSLCLYCLPTQPGGAFLEDVVIPGLGTHKFCKTCATIIKEYKQTHTKGTDYRIIEGETSWLHPTRARPINIRLDDTL